MTPTPADYVRQNLGNPDELRRIRAIYVGNILHDPRLDAAIGWQLALDQFDAAMLAYRKGELK